MKTSNCERFHGILFKRNGISVLYGVCRFGFSMDYVWKRELLVDYFDRPVNHLTFQWDYSQIAMI